MLTPYMAGSVMPINAVMLVVNASDLKVLFFDFKKTANDALSLPHVRQKHRRQNVIMSVLGNVIDHDRHKRIMHPRHNDERKRA